MTTPLCKDCEHWDGKNCRHPNNRRPNLVTGGEMCQETPMMLRSRDARLIMAHPCGPDGAWFEAKPKEKP